MLSKSKFVAGRQCHKRLWLLKKRPDLATPVDEATQTRMAAGNRVGDLVKDLYPGGVEMVFPQNGDFGPMIAATQEHLKLATPAIFEAAFSEEGVLVLCDILVPTESGYDCYEVKSSVDVKDYHLEDAAIQYYVLQKAGIEVEHMYVTTLNRDYYLDTDGLDLSKLFKAHDVTEQVKAKQAEIPEQLAAMKEALARDQEPEIAIGPHCHKPFACEFMSYCWPELPNPSVFNIPRMKADQSWDFYRAGKVSLRDFEPGDLKGAAARFVQRQVEGYTNIQPQAIKEWLQKLSYPLYFLDFESIMPTLPLWEQTRPYQPHFAVQYSIHRLDSPISPVEHFEYLANFETDFRPELAQNLIKDLGKQGSILVYNVAFERTCLKRLISWLPDQAQALQAISNRLVDLIVPFRKDWYSLPAMRGSNSIKSVYPALFPDDEQQYQGLRIADGGAAMDALLSLAEQRVNPATMEDQALKEDLLAYCELDTWAMVKIYQELIRVVEEA